MLKIAIPKGRLLEEVSDLFVKSDIIPFKIEESRKLIVDIRLLQIFNSKTIRCSHIRRARSGRYRSGRVRYDERRTKRSV
jgi:hypothetical protein